MNLIMRIVYVPTIIGHTPLGLGQCHTDGLGQFFFLKLAPLVITI